MSGPLRRWVEVVPGESLPGDMARMARLLSEMIDGERWW